MTSSWLQCQDQSQIVFQQQSSHYTHSQSNVPDAANPKVKLIPYLWTFMEPRNRFRQPGEPARQKGLSYRLTGWESIPGLLKTIKIWAQDSFSKLIKESKNILTAISLLVTETCLFYVCVISLFKYAFNRKHIFASTVVQGRHMQAAGARVISWNKQKIKLFYLKGPSTRIESPTSCVSR
jgi:hypothetical protein